MHSWMFLSSFKELRIDLLNKFTIKSLLHLGMEAFEGIIGKVVSTVAFIVSKYKISSYKATSVRLVDYYDSRRYEKEKQYFNSAHRYNSIRQGDLLNIDGSPIAYWVSEREIDIFKNGMKLNEIAAPRQGLATGDNERFLRNWYEVGLIDIGFRHENIESIHTSVHKWIPCNKGGPYRKWYGNNDIVIKFDTGSFEILKNQGNKLPSRQYYLLKGMTWSTLTTGPLSVRVCDKGFIFETKGSMCFPFDYDNLQYILGYLNSVLVSRFIKMLSPTIDYHEGPLGRLPIILNKGQKIKDLVDENIIISKTDWDSFETSWDFQKHPLLTHKNNASTLESAFTNWSNFAEAQFNQLKQNEEELNRIFIDIYGLQDELTPEVEDKDVTISKADREREIKSFISYAVGCMFGRYSLDEEGLIYAGGDFGDQFRVEKDTWQVNTKSGWQTSSIDIAKDNVIPIADDDYFEDDILERFIQFVTVSFGEEKLEENLRYIAETLGKKTNETSRIAIRRYFLRDFYKDHVRTYKKRPIYWLFDSGKQNGFKALIYMHRYDPFTVARVRTDYLHRLQNKYEAEINHLDVMIETSVTQRDKTAARKRKETIQKQIIECKTYDQAIAHVANQKIDIDLDDGVKVNYAKFQGVEIPQGEGKKPLKANLLAKI